MAPSLIMLAFTNSGCPMAAMMISACLRISGRFFVLEWQMVTVALASMERLIMRRAAGFPTMRLLPRMTTCFPGMETLEALRSSMMPAGVQATKPDSSSWQSFPRLAALKPSTSLRGETRLKISLSMR